MSSPQTASHPFALLLDPQAVFQAVEKSQRLESLHRRVCRPLDRPLLPLLAGNADVAADDLIDADDDAELEISSGLDAADLGEPNA